MQEALYRKYRPDSLKKLVGQPDAVALIDLINLSQLLGLFLVGVNIDIVLSFIILVVLYILYLALNVL